MKKQYFWLSLFFGLMNGQWVLGVGDQAPDLALTKKNVGLDEALNSSGLKLASQNLVDRIHSGQPLTQKEYDGAQILYDTLMGKSGPVFGDRIDGARVYNQIAGNKVTVKNEDGTIKTVTLAQLNQKDIIRCANGKPTSYAANRLENIVKNINKGMPLRDKESGFLKKIRELFVGWTSEEMVANSLDGSLRGLYNQIAGKHVEVQNEDGTTKIVTLAQLDPIAEKKLIFNNAPYRSDDLLNWAKEIAQKVHSGQSLTSAEESRLRSGVYSVLIHGLIDSKLSLNSYKALDLLNQMAGRQVTIEHKDKSTHIFEIGSIEEESIYWGFEYLSIPKTDQNLHSHQERISGTITDRYLNKILLSPMETKSLIKKMPELKPFLNQEAKSILETVLGVPLDKKLPSKKDRGNDDSLRVLQKIVDKVNSGVTLTSSEKDILVCGFYSPLVVCSAAYGDLEPIQYKQRDLYNQIGGKQVKIQNKDGTTKVITLGKIDDETIDAFKKTDK